jgi:hypothetical protein
MLDMLNSCVKQSFSKEESSTDRPRAAKASKKGIQNDNNKDVTSAVAYQVCHENSPGFAMNEIDINIFHVMLKYRLFTFRQRLTFQSSI